MSGKGVIGSGSETAANGLIHRQPVNGHRHSGILRQGQRATGLHRHGRARKTETLILPVEPGGLNVDPVSR